MKKTLIYAVLSMLVITSAAGAQEAPPPAQGPAAHAATPPAERPQAKRRPDPAANTRAADADTRQLLEQVMIARMSQELALDDEQTVLLVRRFTEFREQIRERQRKRGEMVRALRDELRANKDNEDIQSKLSALIDYDKETDVLKRTMFDTGSAELTPWQRARLYLFVGEFEGEMRNLMNKAREKTRRGQEIGPDAASPRLRMQKRPGPGAPPAENPPPPPAAGQSDPAQPENPASGQPEQSNTAPEPAPSPEK